VLHRAYLDNRNLALCSEVFEYEIRNPTDSQTAKFDTVERIKEAIYRLYLQWRSRCFSVAPVFEDVLEAILQLSFATAISNW